MQTVFTSLLIVMLFTALFLHRVVKPVQAPSIPTTPLPSPTMLPTPTSYPSVNPLPHPTLTMKPNAAPTLGAEGTWVYPGSQQINHDGNQTTYTSNDDPDKITDWYKQMIKSNHYSVNSFIQTKTNGTVENKLVGANGSHQVSVEISKKSDSSTTQITLM